MPDDMAFLTQSMDQLRASLVPPRWLTDVTHVAKSSVKEALRRRLLHELELNNERDVHFFQASSKNYKRVEANIYDELKRHLAPATWTESRRLAPGRNNISLFIRQPADFLLSHGAADKNYFIRKKPKGGYHLHDFKHVFVPGPWIKDKLLAHPDIEFAASQIHCVGWPRNDYLFRLREEMAAQRALQPDPVDAASKKLKVLWAPTHDFRKRGPERESTSTYPRFEEFTEILGNKYDYSISLHPRCRPQKRPTAELLVEADVVISDFGTMVYEAWSLGKPVIFPRWILGDRIVQYMPESAEGHIFAKNIGYHPQSFAELTDILDSGASIDRNVTAFMGQYLPSSTYGCSAKMVARTLRRLS